MNKTRWDYLKKLAPPPPRYLHVSARAWMQPSPIDPLMPATPVVERPGKTAITKATAARRKPAKHEVVLPY